MKKLLLLSLAILFAAKVNSQIGDWAPLDNGTDGVVNDLIVFNNELYAAGEFSVVGGMVRPNIAKWNGTSWSTVGGPNSIINGRIKKLIIYNNDLYILGKFTAAGTTTLNGIGKWNGSAWVSVGVPWVTLGYGWLEDAVVYNNELYVIGGPASMGPPIHKYNGTTWTMVSQYGGSGFATMCVYNNELYASGNHTTTGTLAPGNNSGISKWNGTTWTDVGGLVVSPPIEVYAMTVHNSELYVGGSFNTVGGISAINIAKYNGSAWSVANTGPSFFLVDELLSYNNNLYVGGPRASGTQYNIVNVQSGTSFVTVSPNNCLAENCGAVRVYALCFYNGALHVGGGFNSIGFAPPYTSLKNVARLSSAVGIQEYINNNNAKISPNPSTGQFTFDGLTEVFSIEVTDIAGRIIYTGQLDESKKTINLQDKNSGVYFYKIKNKENKVQQGKLIKE
jgi:hypothetical protein